MKYIDLHVHSDASDGTMSPSELVEHAKEQGLSAFALTDHDCIYGDEKTWEEAGKRGLGFLPGMELTALFHGRKIHVVCLGMDAENPGFRQIYRKLRANKEAKIAEIVEYVRNQGIDISLEKVEPYGFGRPLDRYSIMRYMVSLHMYDRAQPIWDNYLNPAVQALGLNAVVSIEDALPVIHEAGGVSSLAHYHKQIGLKGLTREEQKRAILELHDMGLDGMERWYPNYTKEDAEFAAYMIDEYRLLATAGTDFHGGNRPEVKLGKGLEDHLMISYELFERIADHVEKCLKPRK